MSVLAAKNLALAFGPRTLFQGATFTLGPRDKVGLIGPNGAGKSSLLKILAGVQTADAGTIQLARGSRVGYLPQEVAQLPDGPIVDVLLAQVPGRGALERRLAEVEAALAVAADEPSQLDLAQALADLHAALEHFEERFGRHRAEAILLGLGFDGRQLDRRVRELSGGWMMRVALAALLLIDPEVLLLDEPTNHLDVPTQEWFDGFLAQNQRALVLICHDRDFLNRHVERVLSLEPEGLRSYPGNYDRYVEARALEESQLEAQAERQAARRKELQDFIDRFGAKATKARQAQSKQKQLDRETLIEVRGRRATLRFRFGEVPHSGKEAVRIEGVSKSFGDKVLYRGLDASVLRGQRIAVIGANGAGKTTLLRLIAGELAPDTGSVALGHQVSAGFYAQHHFDPATGADAGKSVLETLWALVPDRSEAYLRALAGMFLFSGDDVKKPLRVLSGGERARVALAKLLLVPRNLLLMDEPTNHLDLTSSEALIDALREYDGTLIFVSHNHSFANQLASHVWDVGGGAVEIQPGNLEDHMRRLRKRAAVEPTGARRPDRAGGGDRERKRREAEARNARAARERPLRAQLGEIEARIAVLEEEDRTAQAALADPGIYRDFARAKPFMEAHRDASAELEALYARWEELQRDRCSGPPS